MDDKKILKQARSYARRYGYGAKGLTVELRANIKEPKILKRVEPGYAKNTTGQHVPNAYLRNFGWKNTHYQKAVTVVGWPAMDEGEEQ